MSGFSVISMVYKALKSISKFHRPLQNIQRGTKVKKKNIKNKNEGALESIKSKTNNIFQPQTILFYIFGKSFLTFKFKVKMCVKFTFFVWLFVSKNEHVNCQ